MTRRLAICLPLVLVPVFLGPAAAAAQDAPAPAAETAEASDSVFFESLEVSVVNVDVFVTDKKGERVTGLTARDFEIFEDGRPMTLTNFYAVENRRFYRTEAAPPPQPGKPPAKAAKKAAERREAVPAPRDQSLHVILYFDNLYLRPFNRNKVMRLARDFVARQMRTDDRVMVVSYDKGLHVRQPFTSDRNAVFEALLELEKVMGFAVANETSRRDVIRRIETSRDRLEAESHADSFAKSAYHDVTTSIEALKDLVGSLAGLPGRKVLLHVSDGLPMTAGEDLFLLVEDLFPGGLSGRMLAGRYDAKTDFREVIARANASRVTFYTIDAVGLRSHGSLSAENPGASGIARGSRASYIDVDFARLSNETAPLVMMAADTGGLATFNTNNIDGALDRVAEDFGTYYSLGYQSPSPGDGRYHTVEVKVKRPGLKVRHRSGYRAKTPASLVADATYASLIFGVEANPLEVQLEFEGQRARDDEYFTVPVLVKIPIGSMALVPIGDLHRGNLRVSLAVIDGKGRLSPVEQTQLPIEVPEADLETARGQYFVYQAELLMRRGEQIVAVGVRDDLSGESSYVRAPLRVGS